MIELKKIVQQKSFFDKAERLNYLLLKKLSTIVRKSVIIYKLYKKICDNGGKTSEDRKISSFNCDIWLIASSGWTRICHYFYSLVESYAIDGVSKNKITYISIGNIVFGFDNIHIDEVSYERTRCTSGKG